MEYVTAIFLFIIVVLYSTLWGAVFHKLNSLGHTVDAHLASPIGYKGTHGPWTVTDTVKLIMKEPLRGATA